MRRERPDDSMRAAREHFIRAAFYLTWPNVRLEAAILYGIMGLLKLAGFTVALDKAADTIRKIKEAPSE